jgi:hypothetical protein
MLRCRTKPTPAWLVFCRSWSPALGMSRRQPSDGILAAEIAAAFSVPGPGKSDAFSEASGCLQHPVQ